MSVWASFLVSRPSLSAGCPHTHLFNLNAQNAHPGTRHTQECRYMHVIVGLNNTWGPAGQEVPSALLAQCFHPGGGTQTPFLMGGGRAMEHLLRDGDPSSCAWEVAQAAWRCFSLVTCGSRCLAPWGCLGAGRPRSPRAPWKLLLIPSGR